MKNSAGKTGQKKCCRVPPSLAAALENPPRANPPKETYYRRAVYALALNRLRGIAELLESFFRGDAHAVGKALRADDRGGRHGDVIGRGRGVMPSLNKSFPETKGWEPRPLLNAIKKARSPEYFELLERAILETEKFQGEQLELFVRDASRRELAELDPVVYPAHVGKKNCKFCKRPHAAVLHRFHLRGAFDKSHIGPGRAADRRRARAELAERLKEDIPF